VSRFALGTLATRFARESDGFNALLARHASTDTEEEFALAEYCMVALQDSWSRFVRDLILRSSSGNSTTSTGRKVPPGPRGRLRLRTSIFVVQKDWTKTGKQAGWEPNWYSVEHAGRAITILGTSNGAEMMAAIGSSTNPIDDVRPIRNFAAHRLPATARAADAVAQNRLAGRKWRQPRDIVTSDTGAPGATVSLYAEWCVRFKAVAVAAVR
jgi:hypothetical protein